MTERPLPPRGRLPPRRWPAVLGVVAVLLALGARPASAGIDVETTRWTVALLNDARAHEHGEGVARDAARAAGLYCEAARLGNAEAQFSLGWMYANGRGIPRDNRMASLFFGMAAGQGHEYAKKMLGFVGPAAAEVPECMRDPAPEAIEEVPAIAEFETEAEAEVEDDFVASTPEQKKAAEIVRKLAPEYRVSPVLALAIIRAESNFDPNARSVKNAQGLMQLVPETAERFRVRKPFDPVQNIRGGLAYLRWLLAYFRGDVTLVAAAYNAGEGTVERYRGVPPYAETRAYVQRIRQHFPKDSHPYDATVTDPSPELPRIRTVNGK